VRFFFLSIIVLLACCLPNHGVTRPEPVPRPQLHVAASPVPFIRVVIPESIPDRTQVLQDQSVMIQLPSDYIVKFRDNPTDPPLSFNEPEQRFYGSITYEPYDKGVLDYAIGYTHNMPMYAEKMKTTGYAYIDGVPAIWMLTDDKENWFVNYFFVKDEQAFTLRCTAVYPDQVSYMVDQCQKLIAGLHSKGIDEFNK
jgi:hypothetical protein